MPASPDFHRESLHDLPPAGDGVELSMRSYRAQDREEVRRLYRQGLLTGVLDPLDPAADLENIEDAYLKPPRNHFWVAQAKELVIASIAVKADDRQVAHIQRLRVDPAWKAWRGGAIVGVLIERAAHHAREHDCLKLVLHEPVSDQRLIAFLHQLGFEFARVRKLAGVQLLEFYLNLYAQLDRFVSDNKGIA